MTYEFESDTLLIQGKEITMRVDICDIDGMKVADLIKFLEDFDKDAVVRVEVELLYGAFCGETTEQEYIEIR